VLLTNPVRTARSQYVGANAGVCSVLYCAKCAPKDSLGWKERELVTGNEIPLTVAHRFVVEASIDVSSMQAQADTWSKP
jgi:hypothetical protein